MNLRPQGRGLLSAALSWASACSRTDQSPEQLLQQEQRPTGERQPSRKSRPTGSSRGGEEMSVLGFCLSYK